MDRRMMLPLLALALGGMASTAPMVAMGPIEEDACPICAAALAGHVPGEKIDVTVHGMRLQGTGTVDELRTALAQAHARGVAMLQGHNEELTLLQRQVQHKLERLAPTVDKSMDWRDRHVTLPTQATNLRGYTPNSVAPRVRQQPREAPRGTSRRVRLAARRKARAES